MCDLLCLASVTQRVSKVHPWSSLYHTFFLLKPEWR